MKNKRHLPGFSILSFLAFFVTLFLLFTPFEESGSRATMLPKYLAAGASMVAMSPLLFLGKIRLKFASLLVATLLFTLVFHGVIVKPVPPQFVLLIAANLSLAIAIFEARFSYRKEFEAAVACLIGLNVLTLTIQVILYYFVTHSIFDVHKIVFGAESRVTEEYFNIARFAGLHVEPGTYTNYVSCMLAIYAFSAEFSKKVIILGVATIISVLMTHAASSIFFVSVLLLLLGWLWRKRIGFLEILLALSVVLFYIYASNFIDHLMTRFGGNDPSLSFKMLGINTYLNAGVEEKFIGFGYGTDPCIGCHYQDIGVILNLVSRGGIIVTLPLALILLRIFALHGIILATIIVLLPAYCIMYFYEAPIWIFLLFAISNRKMLDKRAQPSVRSTTSGAIRPAGMVAPH
ncbi:hypothetical protein NX786_12060 [Telluria mixta]|uniref:Uncharacterized protein n=1 Tax=Telluria mixta TaxID=34071 RepID=A0ABT2BY60_9BURK|nr:hypothetical protein [Telluria mixta]MCS0630067.1 hypothetical protein [Telluria mixta]WEM94620.1 hypothetical protein P0M04_24445 [Telluria mixta]